MSDIPMGHYSAALDEIYQLRSLLAYEAAVRAVDLELKSFPKSRRDTAERSIARMRHAANGRLEVMQPIRAIAMTSARADADMPQTLTREAWERQRGLAVS